MSRLKHTSKIVLLFIIGMIMSSATHAQIGQRFHYTQFYIPELTLNPALTGLIEEDYRATGIHRSQWGGLDSKFITSAFGFDMNFKNSNYKKRMFAAGLYILNDVQGGGVLDVQNVLGSFAIHQALDKKAKNKISFGLQGGYIQTAINSGSWRFANQYNATTYVFDPTTPSGESVAFDKYGYFDLRAGLVFSHRVNILSSWEIGFNYLDILDPQQFILNVDDLSYTKGTRYIVHAGFSRSLSDRFQLNPHAMFLSYQGARDLLFGAEAIFNLSEDNAVIFGINDRWGDAAILLIGMKFGNLEIRGSYDATISSLTSVSENWGQSLNKVGAYEISLVYKGIRPKPRPDEITVPCGIF